MLSLGPYLQIAMLTRQLVSPVVHRHPNIAQCCKSLFLQGYLPEAEYFQRRPMPERQSEFETRRSFLKPLECRTSYRRNLAVPEDTPDLSRGRCQQSLLQQSVHRERMDTSLLRTFPRRERGTEDRPFHDVSAEFAYPTSITPVRVLMQDRLLGSQERI